MKYDTLTEEQRVKYRLPISKGYFDDYSLLWRTTKFDGVWLWKHPNRVNEFETFKEIIGHVPTWSDLTNRNLRLFVELTSERLCQNSVRTVCAELKAIINDYHNEESIPSDQYADILNIPKDASEATYLSRKELERIRRYKPRSPQERAIVAVFMIEALTGARHVDSERITMNNVNTDTGTLHYTAKKTHKSVSIPAHSWLMDYLPKDAEDLKNRPKACLMTFNRTIRRVCQACNISTETTLYRRGREETAPKWQFISSHTARRSFATNLRLFGAELGLISELMGHSNTEMTLHYIKEKSIVPEKVLAYFNG